MLRLDVKYESRHAMSESLGPGSESHSRLLLWVAVCLGWYLRVHPDRACSSGLVPSLYPFFTGLNTTLETGTA